MPYGELKEPRTQAECDQHNARRAKAWAKVERLRVVEQQALGAYRAAKVALAEENVDKSGKALLLRAAHAAWYKAMRAFRAAETRAENLGGVATMDPPDELATARF